jgi:hypothetical protein
MDQPQRALRGHLAKHPASDAAEFDGLGPVPLNDCSYPPVCTENLIRVDDVTESPKLGE